jgi:FtsP/CotA-like multicopper oxidase with cupredoxin domain
MKTSSMKALVASVAAIAALAPNAGAAPLPGGSLDPRTIPKYAQPLVVPPAMPEVAANTYDVAVRQFEQQVLPPPLPATKVWGYGSVANPGPVAEGGSFHFPAFTIVGRQGTPTTVTWRNELVTDPAGCAAAPGSAACNFLPYLLPVDQTLHWANPPQDCRDGEPRPDCAGNSPTPYAGPAPIITHLHGGHVDPDVDGYPEAWYLPAASDLPAGHATVGSNFAASRSTAPGTATFTYRNDQRGTTLWYHDHTLGLTRTNVYAGLAGFYLLRDAYEDDLIGGTNLTGRNGSLSRIPGGAYEIPLAIQDRSFNADGSLFYASSRAFFDGFEGPYHPDSDVAPIWNPEFFGNTIVVNGRTWPYHPTEARRYRLRLLNGSDSRFLILQFADTSGKPNGMKFTIIGNDGGFLRGKIAGVAQLVIGPGERYDTVVDFGPSAGTSVVLQNVGPDMPWGGGAVSGGARADPGTTGQVMRFDVAARPARFTDPATVGGQIVLDQPPDPFGEPAATGDARTLTLNEIVSQLRFGGPIEAQLGDWKSPVPWMDEVTENPALGSTEIWQIVNRTVDAHPIHVHQVQFVVMDRTPIDVAAWDSAVASCTRSPPVGTCPPDPFAFTKGTPPAPARAWEQGAKDTVVANPGEITRVRARFDIAGLYVWHCHILSHEDNEMMRPYCVGGGCAP